MALPVKHHTRSKVGKRRSHLALKKTNLSVCPNCKGPISGHKICRQCGQYKTQEKAVKLTK